MLLQFIQFIEFGQKLHVNKLKLFKLIAANANLINWIKLQQIEANWLNFHCNCFKLYQIYWNWFKFDVKCSFYCIYCNCSNILVADVNKTMWTWTKKILEHLSCLNKNTSPTSLLMLYSYYKNNNKSDIFCFEVYQTLQTTNSNETTCVRETLKKKYHLRNKNNNNCYYSCTQEFTVCLTVSKRHSNIYFRQN